MRSQVGIVHRDALITEHLGMARRVAGRVARRARGLIDRDEAESAAMLGLIEAAERFDASRGMPFVAFAAPRIRGAVLDELRRCDHVPRRRRASARKLACAATSVEARTGKKATARGIAETLGLTVDELFERRRESVIPTLVAFDDNRDIGPNAHEEIERGQRLALLRRVLRSLPERYLMVLSMYYLNGLTQREIGVTLGVTESRACQLLREARNAASKRVLSRKPSRQSRL